MKRGGASVEGALRFECQGGSRKIGAQPADSRRLSASQRLLGTPEKKICKYIICWTYEGGNGEVREAILVEAERLELRKLRADVVGKRRQSIRRQDELH